MTLALPVPAASQAKLGIIVKAGQSWEGARKKGQREREEEKKKRKGKKEEEE